MINIGAARDAIAAVVAPPAPAPGELPAWQVLPRGADQLTGFPVVAIGQPRWTPGPTACIDLHQFPLAVIVDMPGSTATFEAIISDLDQLWPMIIGQLDDQIRADPTFGGVCKASHLTRSEFSTYTVQGQPFPAQLILINLDG